MTREDPAAAVTDRLALVLVADEQAPARAREAAVRFVARHGAEARRCRHVALAVSEAVTNVVVHARAAEVEVRLHAAPGAFELVVTDSGDGLRAGPSPGLGQGLHLIASVADDVVLVERTPGLEVRATFLR